MCSYGNQATLPGGGRVIGLTNIIHLMLRKYTHTAAAVCSKFQCVSLAPSIHHLCVHEETRRQFCNNTHDCDPHFDTVHMSYHILHKNTSLYIPSKVLMKLVL